MQLNNLMGVVDIIGGVVWVVFSFVAIVPEAIPEKLEPMLMLILCVVYKTRNPHHTKDKRSIALLCSAHKLLV